MGMSCWERKGKKKKEQTGSSTILWDKILCLPSGNKPYMSLAVLLVSTSFWNRAETLQRNTSVNLAQHPYLTYEERSPEGLGGLAKDPLAG